MAGEDTDGKATQFGRPDETLAGIVGSFHKDHVRLADERTPEPQLGGRLAKKR
jgi:hypothetical protein